MENLNNALNKVESTLDYDLFMQRMDEFGNLNKESRDANNINNFEEYKAADTALKRIESAKLLIGSKDINQMLEDEINYEESELLNKFESNQSEIKSENK